MFECTFDFLFDSGPMFRETWLVEAASPDEARRKRGLLAEARLRLLASNVRLVRWKVSGQPRAAADLRGKGGGHALPRYTVVLRHEGRATGKRLRGVPAEMLEGRRASPRGSAALQGFNLSLAGLGCRLGTAARPSDPIRKLEFSSVSLLGWKKAKKPTKRRLLALLGAEAGQAFWDSLKPAKPGGQPPQRS